MKLYLKILLAAVMTVTMTLDGQAGKTTVNARLDSTILLMGKVTPLHVTIVQDRDVVGVFPWENRDTINAFVEIAAKPKPDTVDLGNNRIQINRDLILQAFDSGMYVIKPLPYVVGTDTFLTQQLSLKVLPVKVDTLQDIHDIAPVETVPFKLLDWVPDFIADYWWLWLLLALLLAGGLYYYLVWYKKGRKISLPSRKRLSPYDEAMANLQRLKEDNLWQNGQEKAYFTALTDILRVYIDRRFHINAVEMTSTQIVDTLKKNDETRAVNEQLEMILEVADIVKFANVRPLADDNELAFQRALNFVEATRPVENDIDNDDKKKNKKEEEETK